jgi:hypothetical protein
MLTECQATAPQGRAAREDDPDQGLEGAAPAADGIRMTRHRIIDEPAD